MNLLKNSNLRSKFAVFLILLTKVGTKLAQKTIKKPIIQMLWRATNYRLCNLLMQINTGIEYHVLDFLKHRSKLQEQYLWTQVDFKSDGENETSNKALKAATKLKGCGQFLLFRNYYTIDQIKLEKFHVCGQHLLCPMCAGIRAARSMNRYIQRIEEIMRQNRKLKPVLITLTVKNGEDLQERFEHLTGSFKTLLQRYRDFKKERPWI